MTPKKKKPAKKKVLTLSQKLAFLGHPGKKQCTQAIVPYGNRMGIKAHDS